MNGQNNMRKLKKFNINKREKFYSRCRIYIKDLNKNRKVKDY